MKNELKFKDAWQLLTPKQRVSVALSLLGRFAYFIVIAVNIGIAAHSVNAGISVLLLLLWLDTHLSKLGS